MQKKRGKKDQPNAQSALIACPRCGRTDVTRNSAYSITCSGCGFNGAPTSFKSRIALQKFSDERELAKMPEARLWEQKVMHGTVPVVTLVNWVTALHFTICFALGMAGLFKSEIFQWVFLYSSIAIVAIGFAVLSKWGKKRLSF